MRFSVLVFGIVCCIAAFHASRAEEGEEEKAEFTSDNVKVLTDSTFDAFIKTKTHSLVMLHAPWCGHCKSLMPFFHGAAEDMKSNDSIGFVTVDATAEQSLSTKYKVEGYPTLKWVAKNGSFSDYTGGRTKEGIIEWIEMMLRPAVSTIEESEIDQKASDVHFVARVKSKDGKASETYKKVAEKRRLVARFSMVVQDSAKDEVTVYRHGEDGVTTAVGSSGDKLEKWVDEEKFPFFGPINVDNYAAYEERSPDMVWFAGSAADYKKHGKEIRDAAKKFRGTYSFVWVDSEKFGTYVESGLGIANSPGLALRMQDGSRYLYPHGKRFVAKDLIKYLEEVEAGKVAKHFKSEAIPETNDDPVKVVVGKNFEKMVFHDDKDVMLEIYAPWCGHCKRLEPIYVELAESLERFKHVVIAKMDGTANEAPVSDFNAKGFPTLFWVKAGEKVPETYTGARTLEGLLTFVKENSSKPVDIEVPAASEEEKKDEL